ncbi:MAG TPA: hypothetical protein VIY51_28560 [Xanthobacteraceae bacterium]
MQAEANSPPPPAAAAATHHPHPHHYRHSAISFLGASVVARLAIVAGISAFLWVAIAWALA